MLEDAVSKHAPALLAARNTNHDTTSMDFSPPSPAKRVLTPTVLSPAAKKPKKYPSLFYLTAEDEQRDEEADAIEMAALICRVRVHQAEKANQEAADVAAMKDGTLSETDNARLLKVMFPNTSSSLLLLRISLSTASALPPKQEGTPPPASGPSRSVTL